MTPLLAALSALLALAAGRLPAHKKYFVGGTNQNNMKLVNERAVDSYFRILKSPKSFSDLAVSGRRYVPVVETGGGRSESPTDARDHLRHETRNTAEPGERSPDFPEPTATAIPITKPDYEERLKLKRKEYFTNSNVYQKTGRSGSGRQNLQPNVRKFTNEPNDRRLRAGQNFYQKVGSSSGVKDKILHKANVKTDRNEQTVQRLDDIARRLLGGSALQEREYRKRNAVDGAASGRVRYDGPDGAPGDVGPNGGIERDHRKIGRHNVPARIDNRDAGGEGRDPPYALFYRTNYEEAGRPERLAGDDPDAAFYSGGVTSYGDAARDNIRFIAASNDKIKPYSAFRDR